MKISNVIEIFDNGEFVTVVTETQTNIHLPADEKHSISVHTEGDTNFVWVTVDLKQ